MISHLEGDLSSDVQALLTSVPGAPERERVASLITDAQVIELDDDLTSKLSGVLAKLPWTVEENLDFLDLHFEPTWIEWSEEARGTDLDLMRDGAIHPVRVGVLLTRHDEDDTVVGSVAWRLPDGKVDIASSFISFNMKHLAEHSEQARLKYSKIAIESWARMMSLIFTHITSDLAAEMEELHDIKEDGVDLNLIADAARRESSAECLFVLVALIFLSSKQCEICYHKNKIIASEKNKHYFSFFPRIGFYRKNIFSKVYLMFKPT